MNVILTGSNGFLGKNLQVHLKSVENINLIIITKETDFAELDANQPVDVVIHFGGVNRSSDKSDFFKGNVEFTKKLLSYAQQMKSPPTFIFSSTVHSASNTDYGYSKAQAEEYILEYGRITGSRVLILKLPNIYGKWAKPDYNSVVATFAVQISQGIAVKLFDENKVIPFIYVDDLCKLIVSVLRNLNYDFDLNSLIKPLSPLEIYLKFSYFKSCFDKGTIPSILNDVDASLYSTYISYLDSAFWGKTLQANKDKRGSFIEVYRNDNSSQTSVLRISPRQQRGEHLHNSKIERFFVVTGNLEFIFRNPFGEEVITISSNAGSNNLIEAIPGWWHSLKNTGDHEAVILVWASENFNPDAPDTYRWEWI